MTMLIKDGERIAVVEHQVSKLVDDVKKMDDKLDQLLELKAKGMGAFWFASLIVGTGVAGMFTTFVTWFKGG
jgi:hypothetical protein